MQVGDNAQRSPLPPPPHLEHTASTSPPPHLTSPTSPPPHLLQLSSSTSPPPHLLHLTSSTSPPPPHLLHLTSTTPPPPHLLHHTSSATPPPHLLHRTSTHHFPLHPLLTPPRPSAMEVPLLPSDCTQSAFLAAFARHRAVLLRRASLPRRRHSPRTAFGLRHLSSLHAVTPDAIDETYTLERADGEAPSHAEAPLSSEKRGHLPAPADAAPRTAAQLFALRGTPPAGSWYASFLIQKEQALPVRAPRCFPAERRGVTHGRPVWWFIGRNARAAGHVLGRPEHTDAVSHDGTWHYQLEGSKEWRLRPTDELLARVRAAEGKASRPRKRKASAEQTIVCEQGDVLVLSTSEWWHATRIPPQRAPGHLSISYARDFVLRSGGGPQTAAAEREVMCNVDGLFAKSAIKAGTVVMTEEDMPDCELPESATPNCEVYEDEQSKMMCLVAIRDIASGEFLSVIAD
ncbi:hypothetical protein AB1Y20_021778 [Prymnesium parvum]|uniref:Uncharacterized protein n=1 Tax=Prymnesium parvum TaxID=97485 RepID=A0AB34JKE9_PRYPA